MTVLGGLCRGRPRGPVVLVTFLLTLLLPSAAAASGTDPVRARQYGLELRGLADAAQAGARDAGVVVAVIDTAVALAPRPHRRSRPRPGLRRRRHSPVRRERPRHACCRGDRFGVSVSGGAPGARIMPVRVLGADRIRDPAAIADAVRWAVDHGADVINLSLGDTEQAGRLRKGGPLDPALREADRAVVVGRGQRRQPGRARLSGRGARRRRGRRSRRAARRVLHCRRSAIRDPRSAIRDPRSVAAPGADILSTVPGGYVRYIRYVHGGTPCGGLDGVTDRPGVSVRPPSES